ncbi:SURF1 family protein [Aliiglaciecola litoralis]|uniref:SURF1-like protein n=2 Tax=Aliiglaciecola litoralis TaxID=582857 RepID=A0ABN1LF83_9ALTE
MQRAQEKQERVTQIEQRQSVSRLSLDTVLNEQDRRDLPFEVKGALQLDKVFLLDNRIETGQVGFHVLVPLETESGVLMINFGWIKANAYRDQLPQIQLNQDTYSFYGISAVPTHNPMVTETATASAPWPRVIQSIDLTLMSAFLDHPLLPVVMQLAPEHQMGFVRNWQPVVMAPEKHYAYALQWFGLALACVIIYFVALRKRRSKTHD